MRCLLAFGKDTIGNTAAVVIRKRISQLTKQLHKASSQAEWWEPKPAKLKFAEAAVLRRRVVGKKGLR